MYGNPNEHIEEPLPSLEIDNIGEQMIMSQHEVENEKVRQSVRVSKQANQRMNLEVLLPDS
jgi:hypothetical protein